MKKAVALFIVGFTVFLTIGIMIFLMVTTKGKGDKEPVPQPINERHQEDAAQKQAREAWIESMHAAAPGTDWRKMDEALRFDLAQERAANWYASGSRAEEWDTIADGSLVGKWNEVGSFNTAGRMRATEMDFTDSTIYTFSQGGNLWKGDFNGDNWAVINDFFNIQSAHFLRKVDDMLIVGTDAWATQAVYRTEDEGITWEQCTGLENMTEWGYIIDIEMLNDSIHSMFALVYEWDYVEWYGLVSIYRSKDLGATFELVKSYDEITYGGTGNFAMWSPRYGNSDLYFVANDSVFAMNTADTIPLAIGSIPITTNGTRLLTGFEGDDATHLYLATSDYYDGAQIYRSEDAGISWTEAGVIEEGHFSRASFNASHEEEGRLFFGGVDAYRSFNGGDTWTRINNWWEYYGAEENKLHADIPYISAFMDTINNEEILLISTDGGLYKSSNNALTNTNITMEGMRNAQYYDIYTYRLLPEIIFAGSQDQGYQRSTTAIDDNYYFDQLISGDYGHLVSSDGGDHVWMVYPGFAMLAQDASGPSNLFFWDFTASDALWLPPIMEDPEDPLTAWWGGGDNLYKLTKSGFEITAEQQPYDFGSGAIAAMAFSPIDNDHWYVMMDNGDFFHSEDGGDNWEKTIGFDGPDSHYFYGSSIVPSTTNLGTVYIGGSGYSNPAVYISTDHGSNFESMSEGLPSTLVYDMAILPGDSMLFAATEVAPFVYIPGENQWYDMSGIIAPYQTYWAVEYVDEIKTVRFGTYGRGIWEFKLYEEEEEEPPVSISNINKLDIQLFPNPTSEFVQILSTRHLPSVAIRVYDNAGNLVIEKGNLTLNAGAPFQLQVDNLSSGIYFVDINDHGKSTIEKLVIY